MRGRLIGLCGEKRAGKDTVFSIIQDLQPGAVRVAFADALKLEVALACGVSVSRIEEHKDIFRPMLQWWGTEFRRGLFGSTYWLDRARTAIQHGLDEGRLVVVTDVRFQNEAEFVRQLHGKIWKVARKPAGRTMDQHTSETEVGSICADYYMHNDGTLADLRLAVRIGLEGKAKL